MIIYVTGAPATGKSTLCERLARRAGVQHFSYSARLRDYINARSNTTLGEADIRESSAQIVMPDDVKAVDAALVDAIAQVRKGNGHLLIDSHPVTKEWYGFRVTPFSAQELTNLKIDRLVCLYATPDVLSRRIKQDPQGRPLPTEFELLTHLQLQAAVIAQYTVLTGGFCFLIDSDRDLETLASEVSERLNLGSDGDRPNRGARRNSSAE